MTLFDYFDVVHRQVERCSLGFDPAPEMVVLDGSDSRRGRIRGRVGMTERTFLQVSEKLEVQGDWVVRLEYAYYLVIDGVDVWAHDNDSDHGFHRHDRKHARFPDEERTLKWTLDKAWQTCSDEDFYAMHDDPNW